MQRMLGLLVVLGLALTLPFGPWSAIHAQAQEETEDGSEKTVNVELILDSSGSMAAALASGETRMDAAKRVLGDVIEAIPDRDDVNVGFRIYGHKGDNTEENKELSCNSSELLVPLEGVDKERLRSRLERTQPTGWTPIGQSLKEAGGDFPEAGDDVVNAVVLVTDGAETCGQDPCKIAAEQYKNKSVRMVTNVIGFALEPEDQERIGCIAKSGGGQQFGADSAEELSSALFEILEELEIVTGTGFVGGNAFSLLPAGESGELSVIAVGQMGEFSFGLPVVIRNNTGKDVNGINLSATARDAEGSLLGAGDAIQMNPRVIVAGGVAFGSVNFGGVELPPDATFEFQVEPVPTREARFSVYRDLDVVEAAAFEDRIVATLENTSDETIDGPILVSAVCFDTEGNLTDQYPGSVDVASVEPGETVSAQVTIFTYALTGVGCPVFLIAGSGIG